jgi:hypothetical protein
MDKRTNNGNKGHSTQAKGLDKRKNEYRKAIAEAVSYEDVVNLLQQATKVALSEDKDRLKAMQMVLEYTLGKPKESIDLRTDVDGGILFSELLSSIRGDK